MGGGQEPRGHLGLSQVRGVAEDTPQETRRLNEEMPLAAMKFLGPIIAMAPLFPWSSRSGHQ